MSEILARIAAAEAKIFDLHRLLGDMGREIKRLEESGNYVHPQKFINHDAVVERIGQLCDQLQPLYRQREALPGVGDRVKMTLANLDRSNLELARGHGDRHKRKARQRARSAAAEAAKRPRQAA